MAVDPKGFESHGNFLSDQEQTTVDRRNDGGRTSDHGMEFVVGVAHPAIGASNHLMTG